MSDSVAANRGDEAYEGRRPDVEKEALREAFQAGVEAAMDFTGEHIGPDDDAFDRWFASREKPSP